MRCCIFDTAWGAFGMVAQGERLLATFLPGTGSDIRRAVERIALNAEWDGALLPEFQNKVQTYFEGKPVRLTADLDLSGIPPFQRSALQACRRIPYGRTSSYGELAQRAGSPRAARAVGGAMARNPLPLIIPCHRVLRSGGALGGFSSPGGCGDKERMLELERRALERLGPVTG